MMAFSSKIPKPSLLSLPRQRTIIYRGGWIVTRVKGRISLQCRQYADSNIWYTDNWELSWCQLCYYCWHRQLLRQPKVPPVKIQLALRRTFVCLCMLNWRCIHPINAFRPGDASLNQNVIFAMVICKTKPILYSPQCANAIPQLNIPQPCQSIKPKDYSDLVVSCYG